MRKYLFIIANILEMFVVEIARVTFKQLLSFSIIPPKKTILIIGELAKRWASRNRLTSAKQTLPYYENWRNPICCFGTIFVEKGVLFTKLNGLVKMRTLTCADQMFVSSSVVPFFYFFLLLIRRKLWTF